MEAAPETFRTVAQYLASRGITCAQCTTVSAPVAQLENFMNAYRQYQQTAPEDRCRYVGIHVEGPYIAPAAKGAHPLDTLLTPQEHGYAWILENRDIRSDEVLSKHADWVDALKQRYSFTAENTRQILRKEVGAVFAAVLEDAGVYKCTPEGRAAFIRFAESV